MKIVFYITFLFFLACSSNNQGCESTEDCEVNQFCNLNTHICVNNSDLDVGTTDAEFSQDSGKDLAEGDLSDLDGQSVDVNLKEPPADVLYNFTVLHTNDLHGVVRPFGLYNAGGLSRHAWLNREIKAKNEGKNIPTLILNAGDTRDGTTFNDGTRTSGMWAVMDMIGYDAVQIGNHDYLFGGQSLFTDLVKAFGDQVQTDYSGNTITLQNMKVLWGNVNPSRINTCPAKFPTVSGAYKNSIENAFVPAVGDPCPSDSYPAKIDPSRLASPDDRNSYLFRQALFYDYGNLKVADGSVSIVNSGLIPVQSNVPEVEEIKQFIDQTYVMEGGVNDFFQDRYGVAPTDYVGYSEIDLNYTNFQGETPLTNLLTAAFLWQGQTESLFTIPDYGNPEAGQPGYIDFTVVVPFVLHGEQTLLKGPLSVENILDTLHIHDLTPDPTLSDTLHFVELPPIPNGSKFFSCFFDSSVHFLLELIYGLSDFLESIGFSQYNALIDEYLDTLQWGGINFKVDFSQASFKRIDSTSIVINGEPMAPDRYYYFSINSTIARFLGTISGLISSFVPFTHYDLAWSETNMPEWVALMNYIQGGILDSTITPELVAIRGDGMQILGPDLTLQPWDITFTPQNPHPGDIVRITAVILNTGYTAVNKATVVYQYDPTPMKIDDNPDGLTDSITGFTLLTIGTDTVFNVPAFSTGPGHTFTNGLDWTIPTTLQPGEYYICPTINLVEPPSSAEKLVGNNSGKGLCARLNIQGLDLTEY